MEPGRCKCHCWHVVAAFLLLVFVSLGVVSLYLYQGPLVQVENSVQSTAGSTGMHDKYQCFSVTSRDTYECSNLSDCPSLEAVFNNSASVINENLVLKQKLCVLDGQNTKVCCSDNPDDHILLRSECVMLDDQVGDCVEIDTCKPLMEVLRKPWNPEIKNFWTQAKCDVPSGVPKVCCPKIPVEIPRTLPSNDDSADTGEEKGDGNRPLGLDETEYNCVSSQDGRGLKCSFIHDCPVLYGLLQNYSYSGEIFEFFHNRSCGIEMQAVKICCPDDTNDFPLRYPVMSPCKTKDNQNGICTILDTCLEYMKKLPKYQENEHIWKYSDCEQSEDVPLICCPNVLEDVHSKYLPPTRTDSRESEIINTGTGKAAVHPLLPLNCSAPNLQNRIARGFKTGLGDHPWLALLKYNDQENPFKCGGTVISERYILTAAHCVKGRKGKTQNLISVRLGEYNVSNSARDCIMRRGCFDLPIDFGIEEVIVHSTYTGDDDFAIHDIALIRLDRIIHFTRFIKPICLRNKNQPIDPNELHFVSGWGLTEDQMRSDIKLQAFIPVMKIERCVEMYRYTRLKIRVDEESQICAGGESGHVCKGDSGGPLMAVEVKADLVWYAVGVVSYGPGDCGAENWPEVFTSVPKHIDWIVSNMRP